MKNPNVTKIAELPDAGGKTIVCKKTENGETSYLIRTVWSEAGTRTKWQELSPGYARYIVSNHFGEDTAIELFGQG